MADFVQALTRFRSGEASLEDVYKEIDHILSAGDISIEKMLNTLTVVSTFKPIAQETRVAIESHIHSAAKNQWEPPLEVCEQVSITPEKMDRDGSATEAPTHSDTDKDADDQTAASSVGEVIDQRYELIELIASGGLSRVYKALDRGESTSKLEAKVVTIHIFKQAYQPGNQWFEHLQQNARKVQNLEHANIAATYDFNRDGATVYLVQEYLSGQSLGRIFRFTHAQQMSEQEKLCVFTEMGNALHHAHEHGILHGDFTPANVMICEDGKTKVMNFGIASILYETGGESTEKPRIGAETYGVNTPIYFSPERLDGMKPDRSDDVYSLACIGFELLTGEHPFGRVRASRARDANLEVKHRDGLTEQQWLALSNALAFDRKHRTYTAATLLSEMSQSDTFSRAKMASRNNTAMSVPRLLALSALVLIALGVAGVFYFDLYNWQTLRSSFMPLPDTHDGRVKNVQDADNRIIRSDPLAVRKSTPEVTPPLPEPVPGHGGAEVEPPGQVETWDHPLQSPVPAKAGDRPVEVLPFSPVQAVVRENLSTVTVTESEQNSVPDLPASNTRSEAAVTQKRLDDLFARAQWHLAAQRLSTPPDYNALQVYREMLRIQPGYAPAMEGITAIKVQYQQWANIAMKRKDWRAAKNYLGRALVLDPDDINLVKALKRLETRR